MNAIFFIDVYWLYLLLVSSGAVCENEEA